MAPSTPGPHHTAAGTQNHRHLPLPAPHQLRRPPRRHGLGRHPSTNPGRLLPGRAAARFPPRLPHLLGPHPRPRPPPSPPRCRPPPLPHELRRSPSRPSPPPSPPRRLLRRGTPRLRLRHRPPPPLLSERSFSALISAGCLDIARSLLEDSELGFPIRVPHYIGLVRAYCDHGSVELAVELLDFMACKGSVPDVCCYGALIRDLPVDAAFAVVDQMRRAGREPDVVVWNILVHGCVLAGEVGRAEELVAEMEQRGVPGDTGTYNALISGIIYRGSIEEGIRVLDCMLDRRVSPDVITFSTLIGQLGKEGRVLECNAVFGWMMKTWILPDAACYRILFGVYCRNSILGDAAAVLRAMDFDGFLDGGEIWGRMVLQCDEQFREKVLGVWLKRGLMGYLIGNGG